MRRRCISVSWEESFGCQTPMVGSFQDKQNNKKIDVFLYLNKFCETKGGIELYKILQQISQVGLLSYPINVDEYDAYYGDAMPIVVEFLDKGKPVMMQNYMV